MFSIDLLGFNLGWFKLIQSKCCSKSVPSMHWLSLPSLQGAKVRQHFDVKMPTLIQWQSRRITYIIFGHFDWNIKIKCSGNSQGVRGARALGGQSRQNGKRLTDEMFWCMLDKPVGRVRLESLSEDTSPGNRAAILRSALACKLKLKTNKNHVHWWQLMSSSNE